MYYKNYNVTILQYKVGEGVQVPPPGLFIEDIKRGDIIIMCISTYTILQYKVGGCSSAPRFIHRKYKTGDIIIMCIST